MKIPSVLLLLALTAAGTAPAQGATDDSAFSAEQYRELDALRTTARSGLGLQEGEGERSGGGHAAEQKLTDYSRVLRNVERLKKTLQSGSPKHRRLAAFVLGYAKPSDAAAALAAALSNAEADSDADVRKTAIYALLRHAGNETGTGTETATVKVLIKALGDSEPYVRRYAALGIGNVAARDPASARRAIDALTGLELDPAWKVRMYAAMALGALKDPRAREVLTRLQTDRQPLVQKAAAAGLKALTPQGQSAGQPKGEPAQDKKSEQRRVRASDFLEGIAGQMKRVQENLAREKSDKAVQADQKKVLARLDHMIEKLEKAKSNSGSGKKKQQKQSKKGKGQKQSQRGGPNNDKRQGAAAGNPSAPMSDSATTQGSYTHGSQRARTAGQGGDWGNLPTKARESLSHADWEKIPARYRQWIIEYFKRVAEEAGE